MKGEIEQPSLVRVAAVLTATFLIAVVSITFLVWSQQVREAKVCQDACGPAANAAVWDDRCWCDQKPLDCSQNDE